MSTTASPHPELQTSFAFSDPGPLPPSSPPPTSQSNFPASVPTLPFIDINSAAVWLAAEHQGQSHDRGDSPMPDAQPLPDLQSIDAGFPQSQLVRVSSTGSSMDSTDAAPQPPSYPPGQQTLDQSMLDAPSDLPPPPQPTQADLDSMPLPSLPSSVPAAADGWDHNPWIPIHEDTSTAGIDELKRLETAGEISALDHQHWEKKCFKDLNDPDYVPAASGRIEWVITKYNGTQESPNKDLVMRSEPVKIGSHSWRIKLYPKGNGTSYLGAYVECDDFVPKEGEPQQTQDNDQAMLHTPMPLLDGSVIKKPNQVHAQVMIVMYNPQEPRVHFHKKSSHSFQEGDPDRGFSRFGPIPYYDLGRRLPETRQAILRNDSLAFVAHIRIIDDPTGFLFSRDDFDYRRDFARTGLRALACIPDANGYAANLSSAIVSWALLPPIRSILYSASRFDVEKMPLVAALQEFLCDIRRKPMGVEQEGYSLSPASMEKIASALHWHGGCSAPEQCNDKTHAHPQSSPIHQIAPNPMPQSQKVHWHPAGRGMQNLDVFQSWELLAQSLESELEGTDLAGSLTALFEPHGFRCKMSGDSTNIRNSVFNQLVKGDERHFPQLLQVELPRQRFDETRRKWLKLDEKLQLSETLRLTKDDSGWYTLVGMILHSGSLASRCYTPMVRPDGKSWFKFATDRSQRAVRLTKKQAISEHESSVYIALYVRNDVAAEQIFVDSSTFKGHPETQWTVPESFLNKKPDRNVGIMNEQSEGSTTPSPPRSPGAGPQVRHMPETNDEPIASQAEQKTPDEAVNQSADKTATVAVSNQIEKNDVDMDMDGPTSDEVYEIEFFASGYYKGNLHKGYKHGKGRRIYMSGDVYEGEFKKDLRHGHGKQVYPNADTYEGEWENDKMHGTGVLTSGSTGNIYQGGFKDGKQHGEFTLTGKKAETMKSCLICYDRDRDAVFYPCGHMCACMDCARELEDCPYCHKQIAEPIRLYVT